MQIVVGNFSVEIQGVSFGVKIFVISIIDSIAHLVYVIRRKFGSNSERN